MNLHSMFVFEQASRKKVYMLYNLEPDRSVTGGSWYTEQDFDSEFVDLIIMLSHRFLEQKVIVIISALYRDENAASVVMRCFRKPG
jgi:hypothetical protein